ncbi:MAG: gliding motility-associated C-terminal domain-containing protein [Flavobacteriales bacterium]
MKKRLFISFFLFSLVGFGQNFIYNGDFEIGGVGIGFNINGQGYTFQNPPYVGNTNPGDIAIAENPWLVNASFLSVSDHTSGQGNMLIVDGGTTGGNQPFWQAGSVGNGVCGLVPGGVYQFSYWLRSISNSVTGNATQANVMVNLNNATNIQVLSATTQAPLPSAGWALYQIQFEATSACVGIQLYNTNLSVLGNDFALDDLNLFPIGTPLTIKASTTRPSCSDSLSGAVICYAHGGLPPYTYSLSGNGISLSNLSGIFESLSSGTYNVSVTDANGTLGNLNNITVFPNDFLLTNPSDTTLCPNSALSISVSGGTNTNYLWMATPSDPTLIVPVQDTIVVSPSVSTTYLVSTNDLNYNLVYNGNFEMLNEGFYSDLTYLFPSNPSGIQGTYGLTTNASFWQNTLSPCVDHTFGNGIGTMLVVDGATAGNVTVWRQTIAVEKNKNYTFQYVSQILSPQSPAILKTVLNGITAGIDTLAGVGCQWEQHSYSWNSGQDSLVTIEIQNLNQVGIGNDFALDDISFSTLRSCTQTSTVQVLTNSFDLGLSYELDLCPNGGEYSPVLASGLPTNGTFFSVPGSLNINPVSGIISGLGSTVGSYTITYSTTYCNTAITDTFSLTMHSLPQLLSLTGGGYNCNQLAFDSVLLYLNAMAPVTVFYSFNGVPSSVQSTMDPLYLGNLPGLYVLDSISDSFCSNTLAGTIVLDSLVIPLLPMISGDTELCQDEYSSSISLTNANPNGVIQWYADPGLTQWLASGNYFYPQNDSSATYYVIQQVNGCNSPPLAFEISVVPCAFIVPSAFTPNGDGENDIWEIVGLDAKYPMNQVQIFNRWGERLYESIQGNYLMNPWDGTFKGEALPVGSYYYVIQKSVDGGEEPINGVVSILRKP